MSAQEDAIAEIVNNTECMSGCPKGWQRYVIIACALLDAAYPGWKLAQVKEKFGGLRFYIEPAPFREKREGDERWYDTWAENWYREQQAIADAVERACEGKCEVCGDPGEHTTGGWIHTLCGVHRKRYEDGQAVWKQAEEEAIENA